MMTTPNLDIPMLEQAIPSLRLLADTLEELDRLAQVPSLSSLLEPPSLAIHADGEDQAQSEGATPERGTGRYGGAKFIDAALRGGDDILAQADKTTCCKELFDKLDQEFSKLSTTMINLEIYANQILSGISKIDHAVSSMGEKVEELEVGQLVYRD